MAQNGKQAMKIIQKVQKKTLPCNKACQHETRLATKLYFILSNLFSSTL